MSPVPAGDFTVAEDPLVEDVRRYARIMRDRVGWPMSGSAAETEVRAVLDALAEDGRLLPAGCDVIEEFAVEDVNPDGWPRTEPLFSLSVAEVWLKNWERDGDKGRIVRRLTRRGPWEPVDTPPAPPAEVTP